MPVPNPRSPPGRRASEVLVRADSTSSVERDWSSVWCSTAEASSDVAAPGWLVSGSNSPLVISESIALVDA